MGETVTTGGNGRAGGGRFAPGNRLASGNPQTKKMYAMRQALLEAARPDVVVGIGTKLAKLALEGDTTAAKLYLEYVVGKPPQAIELSGPEGEPLEVGWSRLEAALLAAVGPYGEDVKYSIALALRGVVQAGRAEAGDGSPESEG